jgi:hypothetical protein
LLREIGGQARQLIKEGKLMIDNPAISKQVSAAMYGVCIALTALILMTVNAHAGNRPLTPSVTIQVPSVEIEVIDENSAHVASLGTDSVNG